MVGVCLPFYILVLSNHCYDQVSESETSNGYNRYMYASDNPLMFNDPSGELRNFWEFPGYHWNTGSNSGGSPQAPARLYRVGVKEKARY